MKIYNIYLKTLGLFFIFYTGESNSINNICKQIKDNKYIPFKKNGCTVSFGNSRDIPVCTVSEGNSRTSLYKADCTASANRTRMLNNPYVVFAKDILRKYVYIFNVVVIYVLLNT